MVSGKEDTYSATGKNGQAIKGKREIKTIKMKPQIKWAIFTTNKNTAKEPNRRNKIRISRDGWTIKVETDTELLAATLQAGETAM